MKKTRVVFMGTPDFAVPVLKTLIENTNVVLVVSQPDKEVGRHHILTPTPVKELATQHGIEVFQPEKIRKDYERVKDVQPDIIITCAYGQIIPKEVLDLPRLGCINVHASLLPKLRGGAPIHHAIIDGYEKTGVTIMYMDEHMDTGDMIAQAEYTIQDTDDVGTLHEALSDMGSKLLLETLPSIIVGTNHRTPQSESDATYAYNIKREEEHIDFTKTGEEITRQIRGLHPWPLANFLFQKEEWKALSATFEKKENTHPGEITEIGKDYIGIDCKDGIIKLTRIKPFGKKAMDTKDYINGIQKEKILHQMVE